MLNENSITEEWIKKEEACKLLGVKERALRNYTRQDKIKVRYEKRSAGGTEALYSKMDIIAFKHREKEKQPSLAIQPKRAIVPTQKEEKPNKINLQDDIRPFENKLVYNVAEASALTHFSQQYIKEAIRNRELVGSIIGRGYKIFQDDLREWVQKKRQEQKEQLSE